MGLCAPTHSAACCGVCNLNQNRIIQVLYISAQKRLAVACMLSACIAATHCNLRWRQGSITEKRLVMNITLHLVPIVSLVAGILILVMPRLLSTIVAIYLIVVGLVGLFGTGNLLR